MTKKDFISRIKLQLKSLITSEKFAEMKAGDLLLTTPGEKFEIGAEIYYVDADGNNAPLNEGEYTFDNGVKVKVAGGKIVAMMEPETELDPAEEDLKAEVSEGSEEMAVETGISMVEFGQMKERLAKCEMMIEKMMKEKEKMEQEFSKFAALPQENPISIRPTENQPISVKKESVNVDNIMDIRKRARKNRTI